MLSRDKYAKKRPPQIEMAPYKTDLNFLTAYFTDLTFLDQIDQLS